MKSTTIKVRCLAPPEQEALEKSLVVVKPMCDLFRMVPQEDWSPATLGADGEMRERFFALEKLLQKLPSLVPIPAIVIGRNGVETKESRTARDAASLARKPWAGNGPPPIRVPLFEEHEKMKLGDGYSEHDKERIRAITAQLVEGKVIKGELNPKDTEALKKAVKECAQIAKSTYNAALEYLCG